MKFCGMQLEDSVPSYSVLSRFRTELTEKKAFDLLLSEINHQLEKHRNYHSSRRKGRCQYYAEFVSFEKAKNF
ncbi:transposase [Bergeyella zoohelcum]|uniref:transposase n=1 Tax=Bergeyella zoohelcum TaxID=1015 RepID=UPI000E1FD98F|nr:transposase [Bergeyella zoohelcum]